MNNDTFAHRRAFYLLKKYSSYTWAEQIFKPTKKFALELEAILRNPPAEFQPVNDMDEMYMAECWDACGLMEEGLALIQHGNKLAGYTKFMDGGAFGREGMYGLTDRGAPSRYIDNGTNLKKYQALGFSGSRNTLSTGMFELLERARLWMEYFVSGTGVCYHPEEINYSHWPEDRPETDKREHGYSFPRWLPDLLPFVSASIADVQAVVSGEAIPVTGIWQPEILKPLDKKTLDLIGGTETYCMNFLVQGREAPNMVPEAAYALWKKTGDGPAYGEDYPVRWRLIWRDDRYGDNGIPDEERNYLRMADEVQTPEVMPEKLRGLPGEVVPRSGVWWTPAFKSEQVRLFKQGDRFPEQQQSDYGDVIWYLDSER